MSSLFSKLFYFVFLTSQKYNIDESHGLSHSMNVLNFAHSIYENEVLVHPVLKNHEKIIYTSAVIHDMCDKKYVCEKEGIEEIQHFLQHDLLTANEIDVVKQIISTMSYSTVKKNGYPTLGCYQYAYHIVREADLLSAYDFDRCMIYNFHRVGGSLTEAFDDASRLFENRVFKHNDDNLFFSEYSRTLSTDLCFTAKSRIYFWKKMLQKKL